MERDFLLWVHRHATPWLDQAFFVSHLMGTLAFCAPLVLATAGWHLRRHEPQRARLWIGLGLSTYALQIGIKAVVGRERPDLWEHLVQTGSSSFPSGHALAGATFYPLLASSLSRVAPRWRVAWWVLGIGLGFFVGFGRLYLGVHWPSDVLAGWAMGAAQTALGLAWLARRERVGPRSDAETAG